MEYNNNLIKTRSSTRKSRKSLRALRRNGKVRSITKTRYYDEHVEPYSHILAKRRILKAVIPIGYDYANEWLTPELYHKGRLVRFPNDLALENPSTGDKILVNLDGSVHFKSKIQIGRSKNRDETLKKFCSRNGYRYITIKTEDINESFETAADVIKALEICHEKKT